MRDSEVPNRLRVGQLARWLGPRMELERAPNLASLTWSFSRTCRIGMVITVSHRTS